MPWLFFYFWFLVIHNNDVDNWIKKIVSIYENEYLLKTVSKNSIKTINEKLTNFSNV